VDTSLLVLFNTLSIAPVGLLGKILAVGRRIAGRRVGDGTVDAFAAAAGRGGRVAGVVGDAAAAAHVGLHAAGGVWLVGRGECLLLRSVTSW